MFKEVAGHPQLLGRLRLSTMRHALTALSSTHGLCHAASSLLHEKFANGFEQHPYLRQAELNW